MTLPKDVDITQLSATYLNAMIRDLEGQAAALRVQIADLQAKHEALLQERDKFSYELELRVSIDQGQLDLDAQLLEHSTDTDPEDK